jgi:hypothetical protein
MISETMMIIIVNDAIPNGPHSWGERELLIQVRTQARYEKKDRRMKNVGLLLAVLLVPRYGW